MKTTVLKVLVTVLLLSMAAGVAQGANRMQASDDSGTEGIVYRFRRADTPRLFSWMSASSLKVDSTGKSHIAYGSDHLYYASKISSASTWNTQVVDSSYNTGMFASLALDSARRPHISYYDAAAGSLKYAFFNGSVWVLQVVDDYGGLMVEDPVVEEDLDARTYIPGLDTLRDSYGPISATLGITTTSELSPTLAPEVLLPGPDAAEVPPVTPYGVGLYTSIAIDSSNRPGISYYDAAQGALKFARWDGAKWVVQLVDNDDNTGLFTSLVFDGSGKPQISYYDATNKDLRFVKWTGSAWSFTKVDDGGTTGDVGQFTSIAIDRNGYTHISYYDVTNSSLKHAKLTTSWSKETVNGSDSTDIGMYSSIALPTSGSRIYISYFDATNSNLKYAIWVQETSTWEIYNLALGDMIGRYTSATLDPNSRLHISYYDSGLGQLREAYLGPNGTVSTRIDTANDVGYYTDMAVDASSNAHIAFHDDIQDDLRYAMWNGSSWTVQVIDPASQGGLFNSIAVDSNGRPHISYYDYGADSVKYAYWNGSNWEVRTIANAIGSRPDADKGMSTAIAIDPSNNYPRIAFFQGSADDARIAVSNGTSWTIKNIDTDGDKGRYIDIATNSIGQILVTYMEGSHSSLNQYLRFARLDNTGAVISGPYTVPNSGNTAGFFARIALDGGNPHIAYFDDEGDNLKHAWHDGDWHVEIADSTAQSAGWYPSIAVAPSGLVYITYYDASYSNLKLAVKNGATWTLSAIDSVGDVGKFSAAGINAEGLLAAAYVDVSNGDLKYVDQLDFYPTNFIYLPMILK